MDILTVIAQATTPPLKIEEIVMAVLWIGSIAGLGYQAAQIEKKMEKQIDLIERKFELHTQESLFSRQMIDNKVDGVVKRFAFKSTRLERLIGEIQQFLSRNSTFVIRERPEEEP